MDQLLQYLLNYYDAEELVQLLDITTEDLLDTDLVKEKIEENYDEIADRVGLFSNPDGDED